MRAVAGSLRKRRRRGPNEDEFSTNPGSEIVDERATRHPMEWATRVEPDVILVCWNMPLTSTANEEILRLFKGEIGEILWPLRSNKCRGWDSSNDKADMSGVQYSIVPPKPCEKTIGRLFSKPVYSSSFPHVSKLCEPLASH